MGIKQKIGGAMATAALFAAAFAPAASAATNVTISDNGAFSKNKAAVVSLKKNVVKQTNKTKVNTFVSSYSNTGGNSSSFNTGGNNTITTGNTTTGVGVVVTGNTNTNSAPDCGCPEGDVTVNIDDNGAFSWNGVFVGSASKNVVNQNNKTTVNTTVFTTSKTGNNSASFNTGGGNDITTGDTETGVLVEVEGGSNSN